MGVGPLSNHQTKCIFIQHKGRIHKIVITNSCSNTELHDMVKTAINSNEPMKMIVKDSFGNVLQLTPSIDSNSSDKPYKLDASESTNVHSLSFANTNGKMQQESTQEAFSQIVKEISKVIRFEDSKKELFDRIINLEKRLDVENLKAIEIEKCRKEIKDLRNLIQNSSVRGQNEENKKKMLIDDIPTYPKYQLSQETIEYLKTPTFNIWHWESNEMLSLLEHMYHELDLVKEFNINPITLKRWLANYRNNPFHNFRHCFCVAQMMFGLIHLCELNKKMSKIDLITLLTACICHDLDHPGYNNTYQINARTELAIRYNDISPLENHHCAVAFQILSNPAFNIFANIGEDIYKEIRNNMIKLILGTDMVKHKEILEDLQKYVPIFDFNSKEHMDSLKMVLIKCCDISNEVRPVNISEPWLDCLLEEYFIQSDREKIEGLPVAPFMDRDKVTKPSAQVGFIKFVLIPMFETVGKILPETTDLVKALHESFSRYQELKALEEANKND